MKKTLVSVLLVALSTLSAQAQTKIFKEVGDEISSQMKTIRQDNALVGYMVFTQLEKVSEDSFNYKVTIMDENLNDIGAVNFRDANMRLQDVSFEQDVLCVAYLKGKFLSNGPIKKYKDYKEALENKDNEVFIQYISLDGKILKTNSFPVAVTFEKIVTGSFAPKVSAVGYLKHPVQLKNISKKGFACFYGDEKANNLFVLNTKGDVLWKKQIGDSYGAWFTMLTSGRDIFLLAQKKSWADASFHWGAARYIDGEYDLLGYSTRDTTAELNYPLVDEHGSQLKVLAFENDPTTGLPYIAGLVMNPKKQTENIGLYTLNVNGVDKKGININYTYWDRGSLDSTTDTREFEKQIKDTKINFAFKDFSGLTYFTGANRFNGAELIKQNAKGTLSIENNVLDESLRVYRPGPGSPKFGDNFYRVINAEKKADYLVADTDPVITIYDITGRKVVHSIPHKDSGIITNVGSAKEGYIMIAEYNKKEKYTKFSIEAL